MDIQELKKKVRNGEIAPVYVLYGSQAFLMDELIAEITERVLDESSIDFNYESFDLTEQPLQMAIEAAETFPFMGDKRIVVCSGALFLTSARTTNKVEHDLTSLEKYLESPADFSVLILMVPQEKLDERKKIVKLLKKKAILSSSSSVKEREMQSWIEEYAARFHVYIQTEAVGLLLQFVGGNMQLLAGEIEKMAQYVGRKGNITPEVVQELISKTIEQDVFTLVDHAVHLRIGNAFEVLHELLKRNEEPIKILFLLARQFRLMIRAKDLQRQGYSSGQMARILGVHPYICKLATQQGKKFSEQQLAHIFDQLAETDYVMKTGQMDKVLALETFLLKLR